MITSYRVHPHRRSRAARRVAEGQLCGVAVTQERRAGQNCLYGRTPHPWECTGQPYFKVLVSQMVGGSGAGSFWRGHSGGGIVGFGLGFHSGTVNGSWDDRVVSRDASGSRLSRVCTPFFQAKLPHRYTRTTPCTAPAHVLVPQRTTARSPTRRSP